MEMALPSQPGQRLWRYSPSRVAPRRSPDVRGRSCTRAFALAAAGSLTANCCESLAFAALESLSAGLTRRGRVCDPPGTVKANTVRKSKAEMQMFRKSVCPLSSRFNGKDNCPERGWEHATRS